MDILVNLLLGIINWIKGKKEKDENPPHLSRNALILFQHIKECIKTKDFEELKNRISINFSGNTYAKTKPALLGKIKNNLEKLKSTSQPNLTIKVYTVTSDTETNWSGIIDIVIYLDFIGLPTGKKIDSGRLFCEAKPEDRENVWRITKLDIYSGQADLSIDPVIII